MKKSRKEQLRKLHKDILAIKYPDYGRIIRGCFFGSVAILLWVSAVLIHVIDIDIDLSVRIALTVLFLYLGWKSLFQSELQIVRRLFPSEMEEHDMESGGFRFTREDWKYWEKILNEKKKRKKRKS